MLHFDRQKLLPYGSPKEIDEQVKRTIDMFDGKNGGVILYGEIDNDFPFENITALYEAFEKYR
jgi:hypothetical protein